MRRGTSTRWFAGIVAVLILAPTVAGAYVRVSPLPGPKGHDPTVGVGARTEGPAWQDERPLPVAHPWNGHGPSLRPGDERVTKPVPEPGTMTLASLGLLAIGTALRKRRRAASLTRTTPS